MPELRDTLGLLWEERISRLIVGLDRRDFGILQRRKTMEGPGAITVGIMNAIFP